MVWTKMVEVRDRSTFIPCLATRLVPKNDAERFLLRRVGYGPEPADYVLLTQLASLRASYQAADWSGSRTMEAAHRWIEAHFEEIEDGQVVDVEFILGETSEPKRSEARGG
jgi:hypothetical protein